MRAKSMAKLLEAIGGPSSFHRHFQSTPRKPPAGKGTQPRPWLGGDTRALLCSPDWEAQGHNQAGIK